MSEPDDFGAQSSDGAQSRVGSGILSILWRRKALVAFGGVLGLVVGILIYSQRPPVYQTTGQVMVIKKKTDPIQMTGAMQLSYVEDYVSSHLVVIRSPLIVERAVKKRNLQALKSFTGQDPAAAILASLVAARDSKDSTSGPNNIINLSYKGGVADECPIILNAVIESYQDFLTEAYNSVSDEAYETLKQTRNKTASDLTLAQEDHNKFRRDNPDLIFRGANGANEILVERQKLNADFSKLAERERMINSQLVAMRTFRDNGLWSKLLILMPSEPLEPARNPMGLQALEDRLVLAQVERADLTTGRGYAPGHPLVQAVQERINLLQAQLDRYTSQNKEANPTSSEPEKIGFTNPAEKQELKLKLELTQIENEKKQIAASLAEGQKKAMEMDLFEQKERSLLEKVSRLSTLLGTVNTKLEDADRQRQSGGFDAKVLGRPGAGAKSSPNLYQFLLGGLLLGLMVGLGLAYLMEAADKGFRTPEEIRRQLGLPVVGHIPLLAPDEEAVSRIAAGQHVPDPLLVCYYRPRSVEAEAYRAVRTALYFSVDGEGHKVIQVTSPNQGDGKSTLVGNLAIAIAQSGKKVLLVDADCRRPRQHKVFGMVPTTGLANYLTGLCDLDSAILPLMVENLSLLPCGPLPTNPAELLTSPRFAALLEELRQRYDFVLVDTPPLLAVTDPCVVAARVDGVLLTISMSRKARPQALRAREILATLGAKILGVVVNRLDRESGSGYHSQSYGYGYGYSYDYTSSDSQPEMPVASGPAAPEEKV